MIRKNPKLKCMCMREAASSYECRAAGLGENQTKLRLHSFPVSGLLLLLLLLFFKFSWTFLSFGREWASDSMTSRFLISRFSLIKDIIFTICVKIQIEPPWWLFLFYCHTCTPPLFDLAQHGRYYLHSAWNPNNSPLIFYFFRDQDS